ncbi:hypothetical protein [Flavobacterium agrisoli]|uniref:Uncharacterized protein n=1 Tax=Flavobacterium agrisoli TaxID=2793066 RepID=A0A934PQJ3_9FLAO|nr:hypothetical protein [Flavobacterium agrisoli]MBK0371258.1 hypothetical protein [Flavobacterium agrisoli]
MAKVVSELAFKGTLDDITFYQTEHGNIARMKGNTGVTKEEFKNNPIFDRIRQQGAALGFCTLKSKVFKGLVQPFYSKAHASSLFGRCNQLLLAILREGIPQEDLNQQFYEGLQTDTAKRFLLGFEGNQCCPLPAVFTPPLSFDWERKQLSIQEISPLTMIIWPEKATQVEVQIAIANWHGLTNNRETLYSNVILITKSETEAQLTFDLDDLEEHDLWLAYIHFRFSYTQYNKVKYLDKVHNSATLIGVK